LVIFATASVRLAKPWGLEVSRPFLDRHAGLGQEKEGMDLADKEAAGLYEGKFTVLGE
jgi:hypothetical protein